MSAAAQGASNPDWAQSGSPPPPTVTAQDHDWKETEVPPPPAFAESRVISIQMPPYMTLKFGVDPGTISITGDGIVRYVVVASRPGGATNAFYEGVRCSTDEVKTYARYNSGAWQPVSDPQWKRFRDLNSGYVQQLASQGLCRGHAPRETAGEIVKNIRQPVREVQ
ncbi:MAG: CNP1-like family protein [Variovorax sp.]